MNRAALNFGDKWSSFFLLIGMGIIFDQLFHQRDLGVNMLLFTVVMLGVLVHRYKWKELSLPAKWSVLATIISACMVVVHQSTVAKVAAVSTLGVSTTLIHEPRLRSLLYVVQQWGANVLMIPMAALDGVGDLLRSGRKGPRRSWAPVRLALVPVLVGTLFFQLYRAGNPRFDALTAGFLEGLWEVLGDMLSRIFTAHTFFFLFAVAICATLLHRMAPATVVLWESRWTDALLRRKVMRPHWLAPAGLNPLDRERRMGVILLLLVNGLLLVVNVIDITWVWFGFTVPEGFSLKQFVHEGTWILIVSMLLSMVVLLYLFRGNLNFHPRALRLKQLAILWVAQNLILGISVFLRNYHYISFHGLAYKRIGVIVFLVLVLVGLISLYVKIRDRKSFFFLARVNGWAAMTMLVGLSLVNWDGFIVRTNLTHSNPGEIDIDNYLAMSDKVLPLLYKDLELVERQMERHRSNRVRWVDELDPRSFRTALDAKRDRFLARYADQRWQEWNMADARVAATLRQL